jgi:hydroxymethylglutaryl-CoA lyase
MSNKNVKLIECPRDAMQGMLRFVETPVKIDYINSLLKVGFDILDCGSFVSPKVIPQMKDTSEVLDNLDIENTNTELLVIVANTKGADLAVQHKQIDYIGFPFSISETFQQRNTNSSIEDSVEKVKYMLELSEKFEKRLVVYISMAFGNPYNDFWDPAIVEHWVDRLYSLGVNIFSMSDTVGVGNKENIAGVFAELSENFPKAEFGAHFHTNPETWEEKVATAFDLGCRRFDGALKGFGGCPMAKDELIGNMPTEKMIEYFNQKDLLNIDENALDIAMQKAAKIFF